MTPVISTRSDEFISNANALKKIGLSLFPVYGILAGKCECNQLNCSAPGKHPRYRNWQLSSFEPEELAETLRRAPNANLGIRTGCGTLVLDVDPRNGGQESFESLEEKYGELPLTIMTLTGGGGRHYFFKTNADVKIPNRINLLPGLDIKGDGGFVVAPGSLHISGRHYTFELSTHPDEGGSIAEVPSWLWGLIQKPSLSRSSYTDWATEFATPRPDGQRTTTATRLAGHLFGRDVYARLVELILHAWNKVFCNPPLEDKVITEIVKNIARKEAQKRRDRSIT